MKKTISRHRVRVLKFAGLLVLAAIAVVFFAFPIVSFAKGGMNGKTLQAGSAFIIATTGTSTPDTNFNAATSTPPTDGSLELVTVTLPNNGGTSLATFLGNSKGEILLNGKPVTVNLK